MYNALKCHIQFTLLADIYKPRFTWKCFVNHTITTNFIVNLFFVITIPTYIQHSIRFCTQLYPYCQDIYITVPHQKRQHVRHNFLPTVEQFQTVQRSHTLLSAAVSPEEPLGKERGSWSCPVRKFLRNSWSCCSS